MSSVLLRYGGGYGISSGLSAAKLTVFIIELPVVRRFLYGEIVIVLVVQKRKFWSVFSKCLFLYCSRPFSQDYSIYYQWVSLALFVSLCSNYVLLSSSEVRTCKKEIIRNVLWRKCLPRSVIVLPFFRYCFTTSKNLFSGFLVTEHLTYFELGEQCFSFDRTALICVQVYSLLLKLSTLKIVFS